MHTKFPANTAAELAALLGTSEKHLWYLGKNARKLYRFWKVPKNKPGEFRQLCSPNADLKSIQKKLHTLVFKKLIYSKHSHFGLKKKSSITNAREHIGSRFILTRDLKAFFPSVRPERIHTSLIKELGCPVTLASLITKLVTVNHELPQGAPTSTDIANLVTYRLQRKLARLCEQWGLNKFTIYADDITFSGNNIPDGFKELVEKIVKCDGFKIANKGGKFSKSESQEVTGINIAHGATVGKEKKSCWRAERHNNKLKYCNGTMSKEEFETSENKYKGRMKYSTSVKRMTSTQAKLRNL